MFETLTQPATAPPLNDDQNVGTLRLFCTLSDS